MNNAMKRPILLSACIIYVMLASGCFNSTTQTADPGQISSRPNDGKVASTSSANPTPDVTPPAVTQTAEPTQTPEAPTPSPTGDAPVETSSNQSKDDKAKPAPFDPQQPSLMSLLIGDTKKTVTDKYGDPNNEFVMDDSEETIDVYEYDGFSVGFQGDRIQFVDVSSADVDPGLNGIRIGHKSKDALKALGKPDSNTTYVISYKGKGAVLKLDVDPKSDTINSIKLFKE